ncbi:DUF4253 domain-containing protein [Streptomyces sp. NBC_01341]|uniref:DUF4253 domain-containing protein n=1 Tax=Streptomyces sp. NBC_01341 TaxID=2903831 RepID=UPI002E0E47DE|nr:DUF4253 domain-containing protein [Streptomyces sp. NBC_01341]
MATLPNPLPLLALPPGTLVDTTVDDPWHEPLLWYADEPARPGDWARLRATGRPLGLLPVLVDGGRLDQWPEDWELDPAGASYPGDHEAGEVLGEFWEQCAPDEMEDGADWPGLAPAPSGNSSETPDEVAAEMADELADGLRTALVPARRSADIPAAIGWSGPLNHENDVARLCAVLRSWEDRFGIRVVALGFDTLTVSVGRPPTTVAEARALAAEHFAFCPDNIDAAPPNGLAEYADKYLLGQETWSFWWD